MLLNYQKKKKKTKYCKGTMRKRIPSTECKKKKKRNKTHF